MRDIILSEWIEYRISLDKTYIRYRHIVYILGYRIQDIVYILEKMQKIFSVSLYLFPTA